MNQYYKQKNNILIVDDSEMNRAILADMLMDQYNILEAENGEEAIDLLQTRGNEISLLLLDIVMPKMDGFEVLSLMNRYHWIEEIPVIMISAEHSHQIVEKAFELGASDYISRPFDEVIVCRRVINTIMLYSKQKRLVSLVADQIYESEKNNALMVSILSHIVEFRNGESGTHVLHIGTMTEMLLRRLMETTDLYHLDSAKIAMIAKAAAFHDIGKIAISEEILNKPARLTSEEFEIMKQHSMIGAEMLEALPIYQDESLVKIAYEICRWHHERYDGKGYPDGLKGEEIPISAQAVSLADAYDALTSERVYKKAFSHEKAMEMILNGECGSFNPILLACLKDIAEDIQKELDVSSLHIHSDKQIHTITDRLLAHKELAASNRTLSLLEQERIKFQFFASMSQEVQFEYLKEPKILTISQWGSEKFDLPQVMNDPKQHPVFQSSIKAEDLQTLEERISRATMQDPVIEFECELCFKGTYRFNRIICRTMWSSDEQPHYIGAIGKVIDIHEKQLELSRLKQLASMDALTNLFHHAHAKKDIIDKLNNDLEMEYAMIIFDLDFFKQANDVYGHLFGDHVLKYTAKHLLNNIRDKDIAARIGGDEFLVFIQYRTQASLEKAVERIFHALIGTYEEFPISISMGIANTKEVGRDYETLYRCADGALYDAKRKGRKRYSFYHETMNLEHVPTVISPIDEL